MKQKKFVLTAITLVLIALLVVGVTLYTGGFPTPAGPVNSKMLQKAFNPETKGLVISGVDLTDAPDICRFLSKTIQPQVENLVLNHTTLEHLDRDISCLKNLKTLNLSKNHLTSIKQLKVASSLKHLSVAENYLVTLDGLDLYPKLTTLKAYNNRLQDVSQINKYPSVERVLLQNNNIDDVSYLKLKNIKEINVEGNPLSTGTIEAYKAFSDKNKVGITIE